MGLLPTNEGPLVTGKISMNEHAENIPAGSPATAGPGAATQPPQVVIQQGGSGVFMRMLALLGWAGFFFCGLWAVGQLIALGQYFDTSGGITEKYHSGKKFSSEKIAIIDISGVIMGGDGYVKRQIDRVRDDEHVKAVVVRIESPGGTITGSDYLHHHLSKLREEKEVPLVVSMGSVAASGGYYVAMAVGDQKDVIFAEPTTTTGSIGVIIPHYDISGLLDKLDIKDDSIATHPRKQMLSMTKPITEDHLEIAKRYINESFVRFKDIIKSGRPELAPERLDELATGEIFTANQAKESGLIDEIGFIEKAIARAAELAGVDEDDIRVVRYDKPVSLFGIGGLGKVRHQNPLRELLEFSVPRPYYLFTSLPPLAASWQ